MNNIEELEQIAIRFLKSLNFYTQEEFTIDINEVENWIQQDFISLDDSLLGAELKANS